MSRVRLLVAAGLALAATGLAERCGRANVAVETTAPEGPVRLEIGFVGTEAACARLSAAAAALLAGEERIDWTRRCEPSPRDAGAFGADARTEMPAVPLEASLRHRPSIWVDATAPGRVQITATPREGVPLERVIDAAELTPVTSEVIAQIVRTTARALLMNEAPPVTPPAFAPPPDVDIGTKAARAAASPPPSRSWRPSSVAINAGYVTRTVIGSEFSVRTGVTRATGRSASVALFMSPSSFRPFVALALDFTQISIPGLVPALDVDAFSTQTMLGMAWQSSQLVEIGAAIGGGFNRVNASAGVTGSDSAWLPGGRAAVSLAVPIPITIPGASWRLEVTGTLMADVAPRVTFMAGRSSATVATYLFQTKWIQSGAMIGLGWHR